MSERLVVLTFLFAILVMEVPTFANSANSSTNYKSAPQESWAVRCTKPATDDLTRRTCEFRKSAAVLNAPAPSMKPDDIDVRTSIDNASTFSMCGERPMDSKEWLCDAIGSSSDRQLFPEGSNTAKLVLRAVVSPAFHDMIVVRIALYSSVNGQFSVETWNKPGRRYKYVSKLTRSEVRDLLKATEDSKFWKLPKEVHTGCTDGVGWFVEAAVHGWHHVVEQNVACLPDVDLGILAMKITGIAHTRPLPDAINFW